ncbi:IS66 family transposase, partial [Bacillus cereus]
MIPYLTHYQCISLQRTKEFFQDCFGHSYQRRNPSQSYKSFRFSTAAFCTGAKEKILQSSVVHFDETIVLRQLEGKKQWLHT